MLGLWPLVGCHQLPRGKSAQDLTVQKAGTGPTQQLTTAEIFQTWMTQIDQLQRENKLSDAIALCERMREPGSPYAWQATRKIAQLCENDKEYLQRAEDEYKQLLMRNPGDADVIAKLGDISARRGHWPTAEQYYSHALAYAKGNHAAAQSGLAFSLAMMEAYERSLNEYAKLFPASKSGAAEAYCSVAAVLNMQGKRQDALRWYLTAHSFDPTSERARLGAASVQQSLNTSPPVVAQTTSTQMGQPGTVELEEAPTQVGEYGGRSMIHRATLPALPPLETPRENDHEWKVSGKKR